MGSMTWAPLAGAASPDPGRQVHTLGTLGSGGRVGPGSTDTPKAAGVDLDQPGLWQGRFSLQGRTELMIQH